MGSPTWNFGGASLTLATALVPAYFHLWVQPYAGGTDAADQSSIGKPERQVRKASHCGSKQQHRSHATITLFVACSHHMYMAVILRADPVRGESHILRNASAEVATTSLHFYSKLHWSHVLFVKFALGTTFTCWSQHHFVAYGKNRAASAQSFTLWQQATIDITCHDHCIIACSHHIYMGGILRAHLIRAESCIQRNSNWEFATPLSIL